MNRAVTNMSNDALRQDLLEELVARGLTRFSKWRAGVDFGDGFLSWCGSNFQPENDVFMAHIFVGIHCKPLEKMWTSLKRVKYVTKYSLDTATSAVGIDRVGHLKKGDLLISKSSRDIDIKRISKLVAEYGVNYSRSIANYDFILADTEKKINNLGAAPERYACCLYLLNRKAEAVEFIKKFSVSHEDYLQDFTENFLSLCEK